MWGLIKNELLKETRKKKTIIMLIIFSIVIIVFNLLIIKKINSLEPEMVINKRQNEIYKAEKILGCSDISQATQQKLLKSVKYNEEQISNLKKQIELKKIDWREHLESEIQKLRTSKSNDEINENNSNLEFSNKTINEYKYFLEKNIKPLEESDYKSFNIFIESFEYINIFFISFIILIICADTVAGEYNPQTIKNILVRPIKKYKIIISKIFAMSIICCGSILILEIVDFVVLSLVVGIENPMYPISVNTKYIYDVTNSFVPILNSTHIIPIWDFLIRGVFFQMFYVICCITFIILISTITKNVLASMSISIFIFFTSTILILTPAIIKNKVFIKILPCFFPVYSDSFQLISGELTARYLNPNINFSMSMVSILMSIAVSFFLTVMFFKKSSYRS